MRHLWPAKHEDFGHFGTLLTSSLFCMSYQVRRLPLKYFTPTKVLYSALNIVGEKDMECAVCKAGVDDFNLKSLPENSTPHSVSQINRSLIETSGALLPSAFDNNPFVVQSPPIFERAQRTSTPLMDDLFIARPKEPPVLRIDNVPWVGQSYILLTEH
jgi:hypothetical protein